MQTTLTRALHKAGLAAGGALLAALLLAGCAGQQATEVAAPAPVATPEQSANPLSAGGLQDPRADERTVSSATPTRIQIPAIGVDSSLVDLGIEPDGALAAPADYDLAGWYAGGVVPGAVGPAIIAGHIDSPTAPAVFARLAELAPTADTPPAEIIVTMSDGTELSFHVTGTAQSAKSTFPTAEVYANVPAPELRLITCAGAFDSSIGHYTDNLIVFAALDA